MQCDLHLSIGTSPLRTLQKSASCDLATLRRVRHTSYILACTSALIHFPAIEIAEDLRVKLGKSQIQFQNQGDPHFPWKNGVWEAAIAAFRAGNWMPSPRQFIVITSDGLVDTPREVAEAGRSGLYPGRN